MEQWITAVISISAIALSLAVNIALVAYAWGSLRSVVHDLKDVVNDLRRTVDSIFPRLNAVENHLGRIEAVCRERHRDGE